LLLGERADGCHQSRNIVINLLLHDCGWVPLRGLEVPTILGALNLNQALGGTTDRANLATERRTAAFRRPFVAERTNLHKETVSGSSLAEFPWVLRCGKV